MIRCEKSITPLKKKETKLSQKHICIIGPSLKMGGIERASCNLANSLDDLNCKVSYIAIFKQTKFFSLNKTISFIEPGSFNEKNLSIFKTIFWLRKMVKKSNPDAVIVFNKFYSAIALLSLSSLKALPIFISERSSPFFKWESKIDLFNKLIFYLIPPSGVIAQTNIAAKFQAHSHKKGMKIEVIPNALREIESFPKNIKNNYVLAVGRFNDPNKGFDRLISAFAGVQRKDWVLVFAGGNEDGEYLKNQAISLGIIDRVLFLGKIKNIDEVYSKAKIFVMPSRSEGFPNALCEAMAAGLACISFDFVAGPSDIIENHVNGILVENGNIEALTEAIENLIEDEPKRVKLGNNAIKIKEKLKKEVIGKQILKFIFNE